MLLIIYIVFLFVSSTASDCVIDNRNREDAWEVTLHKDLQCSYSLTDPPKANGTVEIETSFIIKSFKFESLEEVFSAHTWVYLVWQDDRLKWNAAEYGGINKTNMMSTRLWFPGLRLLNVADQNDYDEYFYTPCEVRSDGKVKCIPRCNLRAFCSTKLSKWPLDTQTCKLELGAWNRSGATVRFKSSKPSAFIRNNPGNWRVFHIKQESISTSDVHLRLTLIMKREAMSLAAVVIHPCIILAVLTVACFSLDVRCQLRIAMICFSLASHIHLLSSLSEDIPKHSSHPPIILFYYRGSVIVTIFGFILTLILREVCMKRSNPPSWIVYLSEKVIVIREKVKVWPQWTCNAGKCSQEWTDFSNLVNAIYFVVTIVAYVYLYTVFIPK